MKSELGPLHLTQTNRPKERGASHLIRTGLVQPRHPSVVFRIRTRSMLYGIYYVQADTMDQVRDTCICKSGFEMTLPSEMSATWTSTMTTTGFIHRWVSGDDDDDEEFRPRLSRFVLKEEYILQPSMIWNTETEYFLFGARTWNARNTNHLTPGMRFNCPTNQISSLYAWR